MIVPQVLKMLLSHLRAAGAGSPEAILVLDFCPELLSVPSLEAFKQDLLLGLLGGSVH